MIKKALIFGIILIPAATWSESEQKRDILFQSGPGQASLLEVYSSEGCSSCPPAEDWLNKVQTSPGLWKEFVPICFHVDYWDYLGWTDILGSREYSDRQRAYHGSSQISSVYTPGFVLNGLEWKGWYQGKAVPKLATKPGVLSVKRISSTDYEVRFIPTNKNVPALELHAALLGMNITSAVKAGENSGRTLEHNFAVLNHQTSPFIANEPGYRAKLKVDRTLNHFSKKTALAVWVISHDNAKPIQTAGGLLPD